MNWLLLVVLVILIGNALIGFKVGFIKTVFSLCSLMIALILTIWISPVVNDVMRENEKFYNSITERVEKILPIEGKETEVDDNTYIESLPLPQSIKDSLKENNNKIINAALSDTKLKIRDYVSNYLTSIIINALAFTVTFVVIISVLWILSFGLNLISKLPILNQINKTAGLIAGLLQGLVHVWIFFILLTVFGGTKLGQDALQLIEGSEILSVIYNNNFLLGFVTNATKMLF